jgi:hypothetical protein
LRDALNEIRGVGVDRHRTGHIRDRVERGDRAVSSILLFVVWRRAATELGHHGIERDDDGAPAAGTGIAFGAPSVNTVVRSIRLRVS